MVPGFQPFRCVELCFGESAQRRLARLTVVAQVEAVPLGRLPRYAQPGRACSARIAADEPECMPLLRVIHAIADSTLHRVVMTFPAPNVFDGRTGEQRQIAQRLDDFVFVGISVVEVDAGRDRAGQRQATGREQTTGR